MASSRHLSADEVLALLQPAEEKELECTMEPQSEESNSDEEQEVIQVGKEGCLEQLDDPDEVILEGSDEEFDDLDEVEHGMQVYSILGTVLMVLYL